MRPSLLFMEDLSKADKFSNELKGLDSLTSLCYMR